MRAEGSQGLCGAKPRVPRRPAADRLDPVECARSRETAKRSALSDATAYGYCASHSRFFWGFRLHAIFAPDGTPRALALTSPKRDERGQGPQHAPIRQRIESIIWTAKDILTLERHGARTLPGLRERIMQRFCCLAACVMLNHQRCRPSRALVDYIA